MTGYHTVKVFLVYPGQELALPPGWKPFASHAYPYEVIGVVARKWYRTETNEQEQK